MWDSDNFASPFEYLGSVFHPLSTSAFEKINPEP